MIMFDGRCVWLKFYYNKQTQSPFPQQQHKKVLYDSLHTRLSVTVFLRPKILETCKKVPIKIGPPGRSLSPKLLSSKAYSKGKDILIDNPRGLSPCDCRHPLTRSIILWRLCSIYKNSTYIREFAWDRHTGTRDPWTQVKTHIHASLPANQSRVQERNYNSTRLSMQNSLPDDDACKKEKRKEVGLQKRGGPWEVRTLVQKMTKPTPYPTRLLKWTNKTIGAKKL